MDSHGMKKLSLQVFIVFLGLTALVAISTVLGGEFGKTQTRILLTTLTISAGSICAMACAAFIGKRRGRPLGLLGIALCLAAVAAILLGLWTDAFDKTYWKMVASLCIAAVGFAQAFLLLLPDLERRHRWVQRVTTASIALLAAQLVVAIWAEIDDKFYLRLMIVMSILVVLETLVIPLLMKLGRGPGKREAALVLEHLDGDLYAAADGRTFHVRAADAPDRPAP